MNKVKIFFNIMLTSMLFWSSFSRSDQEPISLNEINVKPSMVSILSEDSVSHSKLLGNLSGSRYWGHTTNKKRTTCKYYSHNISFKDLKKILVFNESDLVEVSDNNRKLYNEKSIYWKTCNKLWYIGNDAVPEYLSWFGADFVLETNLAVMLIKYINNNNDQVRVVVISKKDQYFSNMQMEETLWDSAINLLHSIIWGHPKTSN